MSADITLLNGRLDLCIRANSAELTVYEDCDERCTSASVVLDNRNDIEELVLHLQHLLSTMTEQRRRDEPR